MPRQKISTTVFLTPEQLFALKARKERSRVPVSEIIRQALDAYLAQPYRAITGELVEPDPVPAEVLPEQPSRMEQIAESVRARAESRKGAGS